jgi:hypothetical protein
MIVITAGTADYLAIINAQANNCKSFGYDHRIFDLGDLGIGTPAAPPMNDLAPQYYGHSLPPATFKTDLIVAAMQMETGKTVCWIDADCLPIKPFMPPGDWDAAVTLRPAGEIGRAGIRAMDYLNAGVIWFRNAAFAGDWWKESHRLNTDQDGLNEVVGPNLIAAEWRAAMGKTIVTPAGYRVAVLDAGRWNCWRIPPPADAVVLHFKRKIRDRAKWYCQQ